MHVVPPATISATRRASNPDNSALEASRVAATVVMIPPAS